MAVVLNGTIGLPTSRQMVAASGGYFSVTNPTLGTGVAYALKTSSSATANGLFSISNAGLKTIQLDRIKLIQTATAATGNLVSRFEAFTETGIVALGTAAAAITPVNVNPAFPNTTGATVTMFSAGAGTVPAAVGTRRTVGWGSCNTGASILWDSITVEFGADGSSIGTAALTGAKATAANDSVCYMPPVTIAPNTSAWVNFYVITEAANIPSYEYCLNYIEL